jgi:uncharacterized membrane protein
MTDTMMESDADSFRSVKLVEFPVQGTYVIGFETAEPPTSVREAVGDEDMVTMFVPLAPNPVMGGFLTHAPRGNVHDIDMSVEEGIRSIVTSGIATHEAEDAPGPAGPEDLDVSLDDLPTIETIQDGHEEGDEDSKN